MLLLLLLLLKVVLQLVMMVVVVTLSGDDGRGWEVMSGDGRQARVVIDGGGLVMSEGPGSRGD